MTLDCDQYRRGLWGKFIEDNTRVVKYDFSTNEITGLEVPKHLIYDTHVWFAIDKKCLRIIEKEEKRDQFEEFEFPFIAKGVHVMQVTKRTIKSWNHLPKGLERLILLNCDIPSLSDMPEFTDIRLEVGPSFSGSIINMFENTCKGSDRCATFSVDHGPKQILRVDRWGAEPIGVRAGEFTAPETELNDVFELQEWLIDNNFSRFV